MRRLSPLLSRGDGCVGKSWRGERSAGRIYGKRKQARIALSSELHLMCYYLHRISISGLARISPLPSVQLQRPLNTSWQIVRPASGQATIRSSRTWCQYLRTSMAWPTPGPRDQPIPWINNSHLRKIAQFQTSFCQARKRTPMHGLWLEDAGRHQPTANHSTWESFHQPKGRIWYSGGLHWRLLTS